MSKETMSAMDCQGCGQRMQFMEQHLPHCTGTPGTHIFSSTAALAILREQGIGVLPTPPVPDQKIAKRRMTKKGGKK